MGDHSKRARGRWGEDRAVAHLRRAGYDVVDRNWRSPERYLAGEIDVVARAGDVIVFCEVKARKTAAFGGGAAAVGEAKQQQIRRLAESWLRDHTVAFDGVRFDVIAIDGVRLVHLEAAF